MSSGWVVPFPIRMDSPGAPHPSPVFLGRLDHPDSIRELILLEQHPLPSGRPRISAPSGSSDDYAMALLALILEASRNPSHSRTVPFGAAA